MTCTLGITGGIGSGKSATCGMLQGLGAHIFAADEVARHSMTHDVAVRTEVIAAFGAKAYTPALNRAWLAGQVFGNSEALARLNAIVHPRVRAAFAVRHADAERAGLALLVYEAALIYEAGIDAGLDYVAVIDAPVELRIRRVMARDGVEEAAVRARMQHQLPALELKRRADYVLDNSGSLRALHRQVTHLFETVTRASAP